MSTFFWCPRRAVRFIAPVFLASLLLGGCASLAPDYQQPANQLPEQFPYSSKFQANQASTDTELPAWRVYFSDPALQRLIDAALLNNPDLRLALLRVQEAQAAFRIQRSERLPTVAAGAQGTRSRVPADLSPTGQSLLASEYRAEVGLSSWELDLWGRVRNLEDAALERWLATTAASRAVQLALIAEVADSYYGLQELDEQLAIARQSVATREKSLSMFQRRYQVGATSKLDLTQVETLLTQARALQLELELQRDSLSNALRQLVGGDVGLAEPNLPGASQAALPAVQPGLPSALLYRRPDIMAAEHQLRAANADIGAARAAFFPRIALTGALGSASAELSGLFDAGSKAWLFMPVISLPIFDGGRRRANLALSEVRQEMAIVDYEKAVEAAFREVADALAAHYWLEQQLVVARQAREAQAERARLAQLRYDHGSSAYLEVLDAQRDLLNAEQQVVQTRRALQSSRVALYAALGGGTETSN